VAPFQAISPQPFRNGRFIEVDKSAFAELLDRGEPIGVLRNRRALNCELNVFEFPRPRQTMAGRPLRLSRGD
jgi:hypothetical protein